jgi:hypothetical protein
MYLVLYCLSCFLRVMFFTPFLPDGMQMAYKLEEARNSLSLDQFLELSRGVDSAPTAHTVSSYVALISDRLHYDLFAPTAHHFLCHYCAIADLSDGTYYYCAHTVLFP